MTAIEEYLAELQSHLAVVLLTEREVLREVRAHLEEAVAEEMARGWDPAAATRRALSRFGEARNLAREMESVHGNSVWFLLSVGVFITLLVIANITAVRLVDVGGLILPAAVVIFPISYIFGDILTEVYGYRQARRVLRQLGLALSAVEGMMVYRDG